MRLKLVSAVAIAALVWLGGLSSGMRFAQVASADPAGGVDPVGGSLVQTFTFVYAGFQPYTQLTLSALPPGYSAFIVVDLGAPVVTDGSGQAVVPIGLLSVLGDPSGLPPELAQLVLFANFVNVSWAYTPTAGVASFRFDACDIRNCVDLVGTLNPSP